jgi:hypothetical protein
MNGGPQIGQRRPRPLPARAAELDERRRPPEVVDKHSDNC